MPIIKIDMVKGRTKEAIKQILDISYNVMLEAFQAPMGDRYHIVNQHKEFEMEILDTGLGVSRTPNEDWSFFNGKAQFLTGDL